FLSGRSRHTRFSRDCSSDVCSSDLSEALLPWGLAFAGGAMLFVVSGEVIPETHVEGRERSATFAIIVGFIAMMVLAVVLGYGDRSEERRVGSGWRGPLPPDPPETGH